MENLTEQSEKSEKRVGVFGRVRESFDSEKKQKAENKQALLADVLLFAIGFVLARCHTVFGARPLGIAFVSVLPSGVWSALFGAVVGSFSLGTDGLILSAAVTVTVLLRAVASGRGTELFSEKLSLRMSVSVIGAFITSIYEFFLSGFSDSSLLFLLSMIVLTPAAVFAFSGLFLSGITPYELLSPGKFPSPKVRLGSGGYGRLLFGASSVLILFFINLSLGGVDFAGISFPFIFSSLVTLFVTKRFGTITGVSIGFLITLGVAGPYSVSFALLGLGAGVMFGFGNGYAVIMGGIALSSWSIYYSGLSGFLTTLPEYLIAVALAMPFLDKASAPDNDEDKERAESVRREAEDMVGTMALAYQNKYAGRLDLFEDALRALSEHMSVYSSQPTKLCAEDYRGIVLDISERMCSECTGRSLCVSEGIHPCITNVDRITKKLLEKKRIMQSDVNTDTEFCQIAGIVAESINREISRIEQEGYKKSDCEDAAEEYGLFAELVRGARERDAAERTVDSSYNEILDEIIRKHGLSGGVIRVFGKRKRYFVLAAEDPDGRKISAPALRSSIEAAAFVKLGEPRYYRRGKMALMECNAEKAYRISHSTASKAGLSNEVSGDTAECFDSLDDYYYSLISDGMGSGDLARETSELVAGYIKRMLLYGARGDALIRLVNGVLRSRGNECSATVDLFEFDYLTGEAFFLKCGAAPSYVKRGGSVFRIRSRTAPIGLMKTVDSDRIKAEIKDGDYVIMLSDGVSDASEDAPWLLELLCREAPEDTEEYAKSIIRAAPRGEGHCDDMSVTVIKVSLV